MIDATNSFTFNGVYRGIVEDINDPMKLGRCKVRVPGIYGSSTSAPVNVLPWARMVSGIPTNNTICSFILPKVGDVVLVFFEGGNKRYPLYLCGTIGTGDVPQDILDNYGKINQLYRDENISITSSDVGLKIKQKDNTSITINDDGVELETNKPISVRHKSSNTSIIVNSDVTNVTSGNPIRLTSEKDITIKGTRVHIIQTDLYD